MSKFKKRITEWIGNKWTFIIVYSICVLVATIQSYVADQGPNVGNGKTYTAYNNYLIFKHSHHHLVSDQDLYVHYPDEYFDLYKYTPTFAAFFGIFAFLPDFIGLLGWNLLNALILLFAVYALPRFSVKEKGLILLFVTIEMVTSIQNEQSNALMVGLLLFMVSFLERGKYGWATVVVMFSIYIKLFSVVSLVLFLFYPKKMKLAGYSFLWLLVLFLVPLLFISLSQYTFLGQSFMRMLDSDHSSSLGYSVMGISSSWFGLELSKLGLVVVGFVLFLVPFLKFKAYSSERFRLLALASLLVWIVIFNHKAESPTFIISLVGIAIWFMLSNKGRFEIGMLFFALILTSLSSTDLFPPFVRNEFIKPYAMKALPSVLVWVLLLREMLLFNPKIEQNEVKPDAR